MEHPHKRPSHLRSEKQLMQGSQLTLAPSAADMIAWVMTAAGHAEAAACRACLSVGVRNGACHEGAGCCRDDSNASRRERIRQALPPRSKLGCLYAWPYLALRKQLHACRCALTTM